MNNKRRKSRDEETARDVILNQVVSETRKIHQNLVQMGHPAAAIGVLSLSDKQGKRYASRLEGARLSVSKCVSMEEGKAPEDFLIAPLPVRALREIRCSGCERSALDHGQEEGAFPVVVVHDGETHVTHVVVAPGRWPSGFFN